MTALSDLIARLEAVKEGSRELDYEIWRLIAENPDDPVHRRRNSRTYSGLPYTISLDAALTLVEQTGLWRWLIDKRPYAAERGDGYRAHVWSGTNPPYEGTESWARTPALALCIAALKAREAAR